VAKQANALPQSRPIYVADHEGNMLELMQHAQALVHPADWLLRAQYARESGDLLTCE
jgi:RES domain-containing protein